MVEPLHNDPQLFRKVRVDRELGTIVWPNGADLDPDVLHGDLPPAVSATAEYGRIEGAPRVHENAKRGDSRLPATDENRHGYAESA